MKEQLEKQELEKFEIFPNKEIAKDLPKETNQKEKQFFSSPSKNKNKLTDSKVQNKKWTPEKFISLEEKSKNKYFAHKRVLSKTVSILII